MGAATIPEGVRAVVAFHVARVERISDTIARVNRYTGEYHAECETRARRQQLEESAARLREFSDLARQNGAPIPAPVPLAIQTAGQLLRTVAGLCLAVTLSGCTKTPTAPTAPDAAPAAAPQVETTTTAPEGAPMLRHGAPVDLAPLGLQGIGYVCTTAPREYCDSAGARCWFERDAYVTRDRCPIEPID